MLLEAIVHYILQAFIRGKKKEQNWRKLETVSFLIMSIWGKQKWTESSCHRLLMRLQLAAAGEFLMKCRTKQKCGDIFLVNILQADTPCAVSNSSELKSSIYSQRCTSSTDISIRSSLPLLCLDFLPPITIYELWIYARKAAARESGAWTLSYIFAIFSSLLSPFFVLLRWNRLFLFRFPEGQHSIFLGTNIYILL